MLPSNQSIFTRARTHILIALSLLLASISPSWAGLIMVVDDSGGNTLITASGHLDHNALYWALTGYPTDPGTDAGTNPSIGVLQVGPQYGVGNQGRFYRVSGPGSFGSGGDTLYAGTYGLGQVVEIRGNESRLFLDNTAYAFSRIDISNNYPGKSITSLGMKPGIYTWWTDGGPDHPKDSIMLVIGVPLAPVVTPTPKDSQSIALSWSVPSNNGSPVTGYKIRFREIGGNWQNFPFTGTGTSTTVSFLTTSTNYEFEVTAFNARGDGLQGLATASTLAGTSSGSGGPTAPTNIAATAGIETISVAFTPSNGSGVIEYTAACLSASVSPNSLIGVSGSGSPLVIPDAIPGAAYYCDVDATNSGGTTAGATTPTTVTPTFPSPVLLSSVADSAVTLSWNPIPLATGYTVEYRLVGTATWTSWPIPGNGTQTQTTITGLTPGARYEFSVAAQRSLQNPLSTYTGPSATVVTGPPAPVAPVANSDSYSTGKNVRLVVPASGVLVNDTNPNQGTLTASLKVPALHGYAVLSGDGTLSYVPYNDFVGQDSFTYQVVSSTSPTLISNEARVQINVADYAAGQGGTGGASPNGATPLPPIANPDAWTLSSNTPLTVPNAGVIRNDVDPQNYQLVVSVKGQPTHGTLVLSAQGGFTYTPNTGFVGTDTFTYTLSNGVLTSVGTVTLTVQSIQANKPPVGSPDAYLTPMDVILSVPAPGVLGNDYDPEGHVLTVAILNPTSHGVVTLSPQGQLTYYPNKGYTGQDSLTYSVSDGVNTTGPVWVSIKVNPVNATNLPPVARPDAWTTAKGTRITVPSSMGVLLNDSDPEGAPLQARLATYPKNGTFAPIDGGGFVYTPNAGFVGQDTLTYSVSDGQLESKLTTVTLTVNDKNTPPIANPDVFTIHSEELLTVPSPGVLLNDIDPEGHQLQSLLKTLPAHGVFAPMDGGGFTYLPDPGFIGEDRFTYSVNDGELESSVTTVTIRVTDVATNRVPLARADRYIVQQGIALTVPPNGVLLNDRDPNGHPLVAFQSQAPAHGSIHIEHDGSFTYYPNPDFVGQDSFDYYVNDGLRDSKPARVRITVKPSNRAPRTRGSYFQKPATDAVISAETPGLLKYARDPDGNFLTPFIVEYPAHGLLKLNQNGAFTYYPEAGFTGKDTFRWKVTDGLLDSNLGTAVLNCAACNRNE
jgi:hypothetical protein